MPVAPLPQLWQSKPSPDITKYPQGGQITPGQNFAQVDRDQRNLWIRNTSVFQGRNHFRRAKVDKEMAILGSANHQLYLIHIFALGLWEINNNNNNNKSQETPRDREKEKRRENMLTYPCVSPERLFEAELWKWFFWSQVFLLVASFLLAHGIIRSLESDICICIHTYVLQTCPHIFSLWPAALP